MLHNRAAHSLFICSLLLFTCDRSNSADEGHHEITELMEKVSSTVCSSKTSVYNENCFLKIVNDYFGRFTWCGSEHASCFLCNDSMSELGKKLFTLYNSGGQISKTEMEKVGISLMVLTHDKDKFCKSNPTSLGIVSSYTYAQFWNDMSSEQGFKKNKVSWLEHVYEDLSKSFDTTKNKKCTTSKIIIEESHAASEKTDEGWAKAVSLFSVLHVLNGYQLDAACTILPTTSAILGNLYRSLNVTSTNKTLSEAAILKIMAKLGIGNPSSSTSGGDHGHGHEHAHENHRRKRSINAHHRVRRAVEFKNANVSQCLTVDNLFKIYNIDESAGVSLTQLKDICPAFLEQTLTGVCTKKPPATNRISTAQAYGYGALAIFIVCCGSLLGAIFIPCIGKKSFDLIILFAIALSIGTLLCDSLLHLIPDALGLHSHEHSGPVKFEPPQPYFWKMLVLCGAIYIWYLIDLMMVYWFSDAPDANHGHSHNMVDPGYANKGFQMAENDKENNLELVNVNKVANDTNMASQPLSTASDGSNHQSRSMSVSQTTTDSNSVQNSRLTAIFVICGDTIHNFADGLAIGAAFATSLSGGISTSIAVLCHELPHELGDFAILLSSNMSVKKAMLMNFASALSAFVGFFIGVPIGSNVEARNWIFVVTASIFIYISLSSLLASLKNSCPGTKLTSFLLQAGGFFVGMVIIVIIGLFESMIRI